MRPPLRGDVTDNYSEGARLLWGEMAKRGLNQTAADDLIGVSHGLVNRLLYGERKPGRAVGERIRDVFGIDPKLWDADPLEAFQPPTRTGTEG